MAKITKRIWHWLVKQLREAYALPHQLRVLKAKKDVEKRNVMTCCRVVGNNWKEALENLNAEIYHIGLRRFQLINMESEEDEKFVVTLKCWYYTTQEIESE